MQTVRVSQEGKWGSANGQIRAVFEMNPQIYFCKKIRNIIFDTICYRFHSAFDSQFDGVLFDNQEGAYIKTDARLEEIPGIPEILDAWGYFTDFFNVWPRATQKLGYICTLHVLK